MEEIQNNLKNLIDLYFLVKSLVITIEEYDDELKTDIQIINEFRNSFDHLMRALSVEFKINDTKDIDYVKKNIDKSYGHIYRAGYDCLDFGTVIIRDRIIEELKLFSLETINKIFPEYYPDWLPKIETITDNIITCRDEKDVGAENIDNFIHYVKQFNELKEIYDKIINKKAALISYEYKLKKEKKTDNKKDHIIRFILTIISGLIVGVIVTIYFKK